MGDSASARPGDAVLAQADGALCRGCPREFPCLGHPQQPLAHMAHVSGKGRVSAKGRSVRGARSWNSAAWLVVLPRQWSERADPMVWPPKPHTTRPRQCAPTPALWCPWFATGFCPGHRGDTGSHPPLSGRS